MLSAIPIEAFEKAHDAAFLVDERGVLRMINPAAELLLGCSGGTALGQPCWQVAQLRYRNGVPFCGPDCPVLREARDNGGRIERQRLARRRARGRALEVELFSVVAASAPDGRTTVLHLLTPGPARAQRPARQREEARTDAHDGRLREIRRPEARPALPPVAAVLPEIAQGRRRLHLLSLREREILTLLGRGYSTRRIAEALCISPNTVRNHVRSILDKLRVHRRLEAALLWLEHAG